jgi:hypothetical protein
MHCGAWEYADRISLQQLELALGAKGITNSALYQHIHREILRWPEGREIIPKWEPTIDQLLLQAGGAVEQALVRRCRYPELLYKFRNSLVHEYRTVGSGFDRGGDYVFYHSQSGAPWQLFIPPGFLFTLSSRILDSVRDHLRGQSIDPAVLLDPTHLWV